MTYEIQPDSALDPGLVGSLVVLRDTTRGTHQENINFASALLYMYPEGADAIIASLSPILGEFAEHEGRERKVLSSPGILDDFWSKLLALPAATPAVETVRNTAQQWFLEGITQRNGVVLSGFLGGHGSGPMAITSLLAIAEFARGLGKDREEVQQAVHRTESIHVARAVQAGNVPLIQAIVGLGPVDRVMGGDKHGSWLRQWAWGARRATTEDRAESTLVAFLDLGMDINQVDSEGYTALGWVLSTTQILKQDSQLAGARLGKSMVDLHSPEATEAAFKNSAPVASLLLDYGARWEDLAGLHPLAQAILDAHPAVRRAKLGEVVVPEKVRTGPAKRNF